ncbi:MAG TPA: DUF3842 family protein [Proteiniclasticum sp.]|nr:DUF3842 family protein [Proteiniclasticum sp.]
MLKLAVIDGQGGGIGKSLIEKILKSNLNNIDIIALGTNALATAGMIKAGARTGATGENAIIVNAGKMDVIMGPIAIVIPNSIMGEITQGISLSVGNSEAMKILIPLNRCNVEIPGTTKYTVAELIDLAVEELRKYQGSLNE